MAEARNAIVIKLHRCPNEVVRLRAHPCHRVQKALAAAGIEYEVVKHPWRPERRDELERLSGQRKLPVIEFESGATYREESKEMADRIAAGHLAEQLARLPPADRPHDCELLPGCGETEGRRAGGRS